MNIPKGRGISKQTTTKQEKFRLKDRYKTTMQHPQAKPKSNSMFDIHQKRISIFH